MLRKTLSLGKFFFDEYGIFSPPTIEDESDLIEFDDPLCSLDDKS